MAKHDDQKAGLEIKPGLTVGKATHAEWLRNQNLQGGHDLSKETKGASVDGSGGADVGLGSFNDRPVK